MPYDVNRDLPLFEVQFTFQLVTPSTIEVNAVVDGVEAVGQYSTLQPAYEMVLDMKNKLIQRMEEWKRH